MQGTITYFNSRRGFGFITILSGESYFFHVSSFAKDSQPVLEGKVAFQLAPPIRVGQRPQAVNVRYTVSDKVSVPTGVKAGA